MLSGDIGSGKSTILLAIEFALFGVNKGQITGESMLKTGEKEGSVELKFSVSSKDVIVCRNLKRGARGIAQSGGSIEIGGVKSDLMPTELKSKILELLGYPMDLVTKNKDIIYRYTVYTPQEMMKQILFEDREVRLNILRKVFGIDKYKTIIENCSVVAKEFREKKKKYEGMFYDLEAKESFSKQINEEISGIKPQIDLMDRKHESLLSEYSLLSKELLELENNFKIYNEMNLKLKQSEIEIRARSLKKKELGEEKQAIEGQIAELLKKTELIQVLNLPSEEDIENQMKEKEIIVRNVLEKKTKIVEKIGMFNSYISDFEKKNDERDLSVETKRIGDDLVRLEELVSQKELNESEVNILNEDIKKLQRKINILESNIENSKKMIENITSIEECPTCFQKVDDDHKNSVKDSQQQMMDNNSSVLNSLKSKMKDYEVKLESSLSVSKKISEGQVNVALLKSKLNEIELLISRQKEESEKIVKIKENVDSLRKELLLLPNIDEKKQELDNLKAAFKKIKDNQMREKEKKHIDELLVDKKKRQSDIISLIAGLDFEILELKTLFDNMKKDVERYSSLDVKIEEARTALEAKKNEMHKIDVESKALKQKILGLNENLSKIMSEIEVKKDAKEKHGKIGGYQHWLSEHFIKLMSNIERHLLLRVYSEFNDLFQNWFSMLMDDEMMSAKLDEDFTPVIEVNGYEIAVENLSGGEKTAVALSYRLALNKIINDLISTINTKDLLILDEPTDGFSSQQLDRVRDVLDELDTGQVIIVSHESKIESYVENVIRVTKVSNQSEVRL